ncbi:MAG: recombinase XerD [Natrialbaceae archaeon]|nr:recombinase XerD [Natrialbaceae archaeon]
MSDPLVADAIDRYLERKSVGNSEEGAGTYATNAESILGRWAEWLETTQDIESLFTLEPSHLRAYADHLSDLVAKDEYTASTARTYFAVVRAFLSWCVEGGILDENPAQRDDVTAALPKARGAESHRHWTPDKRGALFRHVRAEVAASADGAQSDRLAALRDYALVAVLANANVRGAELFRVPEDDRRTGATWEDVDFYAGTLDVLGTSQRREAVDLPAEARTPLRKYRVVLDPPTNGWPLFPTRHAPSIASRVRTVLESREYEPTEIDELMAASTAAELARDHNIPPPAITTEGARSVLKRLCREAGITVKGDYLTPRGARMGRQSTVDRREASTSEGALRAAPEQSIAVPQEPEDGTDSEED